MSTQSPTRPVAAAILLELEGGGPAGGHDSSTNGLINFYKDLKGRGS